MQKHPRRPHCCVSNYEEPGHTKEANGEAAEKVMAGALVNKQTEAPAKKKLAGLIEHV
jgi:hypothetical protein